MLAISITWMYDTRVGMYAQALCFGRFGGVAQLEDVRPMCECRHGMYARMHERNEREVEDWHILTDGLKDPFDL
jgi:hypothetical protein